MVNNLNNNYHLSKSLTPYTNVRIRGANLIIQIKLNKSTEVLV